MKNSKLFLFLKNKYPLIIDIYLFISTGIYIIWQTYKTYNSGNLDFSEILFTLQNALLVFFFLFRIKEHKLNFKIFDQVIALTAFFSGLFFLGSSESGGQLSRYISKGIIITATILGILTILNLGKSFGILIALRKVKTNGLYSFIRHPMYMTDILFRFGYLVGHCNIKIISLTIASTCAYIYRAILEEKFLSQSEEYKIYITQVKYRFIPHVF